MNSQLVSLDAPGSSTSKQDVEADFFLLSTCNFRCKYCFVPQNALAAPIHRYAENEEWESAFNADGKRWLIHVSGGEPFACPQFTDPCQRLTRRHLLSINSKHSNSSVEEFAEVIDPKRVNFINAAIHLEQRMPRRSSPVRFRQWIFFAAIATAPRRLTRFRCHGNTILQHFDQNH